VNRKFGSMFIIVRNISSYMTGINTAKWKQTSYSTSFSKKYRTNDTCTATVKGTYTLAITIHGLPIGLSRGSTWTAKLTLV
jgi:hypothetical protein